MSIKHIQLTEYGEAVETYPDTENRDPETYKLNTCVHSICNGWVDCKKVSPTHVALVCRSCHLRVLIPKEIDTWAKLEKHFYKKKEESSK